MSAIDRLNLRHWAGGGMGQGWGNGSFSLRRISIRRNPNRRISNRRTLTLILTLTITLTLTLTLELEFGEMEFGKLKFGELKGHRGNGSFEIYSAMFPKPNMYFGKHCTMMPNGNRHVVGIYLLWSAPCCRSVVTLCLWFHGRCTALPIGNRSITAKNTNTTWKKYKTTTPVGSQITKLQTRIY